MNNLFFMYGPLPTGSRITVIKMIDVCKFSDRCFSLFKSESRNFEIIDITLSYSSMHRMHGATGNTGWSGRVVLKGWIHQGTPWIHDTRDAFTAVIQVTRMFQPERVTIFMGSCCRAFV